MAFRLSGQNPAALAAHREHTLHANKLTRETRHLGSGVTAQHHLTARDAHARAASTHLARAAALKAQGQHLKANPHLASAAVHARHVAHHEIEHHILTGKRGGKYYISKSGLKVYGTPPVDHKEPKPPPPPPPPPPPVPADAPHKVEAARARALSKEIERHEKEGTKSFKELSSLHFDAAQAHSAAALSHEDRALDLQAAGERLRANPHIATAAVHKRLYDKHIEKAHEYERKHIQKLQAEKEQREAEARKKAEDAALQAYRATTHNSVEEGGRRDETGRYLRPPVSFEEVQKRAKTLASEITDNEAIHVRGYIENNPRCKFAHADWNGRISYSKTATADLSEAIARMQSGRQLGTRQTWMMTTAVHEHLHLAGSKGFGSGRTANMDDYTDKGPKGKVHVTFEEGTVELLAHKEARTYLHMMNLGNAGFDRQQKSAYPKEVHIVNALVNMAHGNSHPNTASSLVTGHIERSSEAHKTLVAMCTKIRVRDQPRHLAEMIDNQHGNQGVHPDVREARIKRMVDVIESYANMARRPELKSDAAGRAAHMVVDLHRVVQANSVGEVRSAGAAALKKKAGSSPILSEYQSLLYPNT